MASNNNTSAASSVASSTPAHETGAKEVTSPRPLRAVRLTAGRVEKLVASLERIAAVLASLGAETREVNKAIKLLVKPAPPASTSRKLNPSAYNLFVQRTMPVVRAEHPSASAKERMQLCAALWKESKKAEGAAGAE